MAVSSTQCERDSRTSVIRHQPVLVSETGALISCSASILLDDRREADILASDGAQQCPTPPSLPRPARVPVYPAAGGAAVGHVNTPPVGRIARRPVNGQTRAKIKGGYPCRTFISSMP